VDVFGFRVELAPTLTSVKHGHLMTGGEGDLGEMTTKKSGAAKN
jgi:hypothetical protein